MRRTLALRLLFVSAGFWILSSAAFAQNSGVPSYAKVKQSLGLVAIETSDNHFAYGTAFCIESDDRRSYFLTSAHVVGNADAVGIQLEADGQVYKGFVLRTSVAPLDAAVIEVEKGHIPALTLAQETVSPGAPIAVMGYPSIQIETDRHPSVHAGTVSDIMQNFYIEYDAITDHGNSGGPVFDPQTGLVYGIATAILPSQTARAVQSNLAILIGQATAFLGNAGVHPTIQAIVAQASQPPELQPTAAPSSVASSEPSPELERTPDATAAPVQVATSSPAPTATPQPKPESTGDILLGLIDLCTSTYASKNYQYMILRCSETLAAMKPAKDALKALDYSDDQVLTTYGLHYMDFMLAMARKQVGDTGSGRASAEAAVTWAYATMGMYIHRDPHGYNKATNELAAQLKEHIDILEVAYPGTSAKVKAELRIK
jgi:S1-C subfamily serine protease